VRPMANLTPGSYAHKCIRCGVEWSGDHPPNCDRYPGAPCLDLPSPVYDMSGIISALENWRSNCPCSCPACESLAGATVGGGKDLSFDVNKAREEMLAEIDEVLQESGHWVGGRLDTIKKLCGVK